VSEGELPDPRAICTRSMRPRRAQAREIARFPVWHAACSPWVAETVPVGATIIGEPIDGW